MRFVVQSVGRWIGCFVLAVVAFLAVSCSNSPYRDHESAEATYFGAFSTPPTKMDPARAYYSHEGRIIDQVYEPPFTYHYLERPYRLIPLTATEVPEAVHFDKDGVQIEERDPDAARVGRSEYTIRIRPGIMYQPHPCFARKPDGSPFYTDVSYEDIRDYDSPMEFPEMGTREVEARDYVLQARRLADPRLTSPVFSVMAGYIEGMAELNQAYQAELERIRAERREQGGPTYNQEADEKENPIALDYMAPPCPGFEVIDRYTYRVTLKKKYPQILYWMCMHFFAAMPQEAIDLYNQPAMVRKQFVVNRWPVGSGPYYLHTFAPNQRIELRRNPNYHEDRYPECGEPGDESAGLLVDAGKRLPFIDRQVLQYDKEFIPTWNKFMQGYYDTSGIGSDVFDQAIQFRPETGAGLSDEMESRNIRLITEIETTFYYLAFNMTDDVVGGYDDAQCKLRQAISIALDYGEFLEIFRNGRGILSQGPLPPGIFGYRVGEEGTNPFVDRWDDVAGKHRRQPIERARTLLAEAGYPDGIRDGRPLTLYYDHASAGSADFRSNFIWMRTCLERIGVRLEERGTDLSRFREKRSKGNWQLSSSGWLADYPDPENFLFLFYGPNGKVEHGGPNAYNYKNPEFDRLFETMESMANSPKRQEIIDEMVHILQHDAPAVWMFNPKSFLLVHDWYRNVKPHSMSYNTMKYRRIVPGERVLAQEEWNRPLVWPVAFVIVVVVALFIPAAVAAWRRERGL